MRSVAPADHPVSIVSAGAPVAVGLQLSVDKVRFKNNGSVAVTALDVAFELEKASRFDYWPFSFEYPQRDPACAYPAGQGIPSYVVVCRYAVQLAPGATVDVPVQLSLSPSTDSATAPAPSLKITVGAGEDADSTTVGPVNRVKRTADLAVRLAAKPKGRVGDVVDVQWIATNNGPDVLQSVYITLIAPPGTEWTGAAAAACNPPTIPNTKYVCVSDDRLAPGAGHLLTETWQLKILSPTVGSGEIRVASNSWAGTDPYLEILDPAAANNTLALRVDVDTSTGAPRPSTSATAGQPGGGGTTGAPQAGGSSSPAATGGLPTTGANIALTGGVGLAALTAGAVLIVLARRRRAHLVDED